ncbi:MAG TPA: diguanylate cyclase [Acidobacteria bacterium]|nr:diguanylate cyclase [Acidobacteriota bacterium]
MAPGVGKMDKRSHGEVTRTRGGRFPSAGPLFLGVLGEVLFAPPAGASATGAVSSQFSSMAGRVWFEALLVFVTILLVAMLAWRELRVRRKAEQWLAHEVRMRTEEIERTGEILQRINEGVGVEEVLELVWETFRPLIPYDRISYAELLDGGGRVGVVWVRSSSDEIRLPVGFEALTAGTSLSAVLEQNEPRILNDLQAYLREHPDSVPTRLIVEEGMRSSLTVPLRGLEQVQGFLFFNSREPGAYTADHVRIIQRLASQLGVIIGKSRLHEELIVAKWNLEEANRRLESLARIDPLTGLGNRRFFEDRLESEWRRQLREGGSLGLILVDLDNFKEYNDTYGHQAGDVCLRKVAGVLQSVARRAGDEVARWGGEELAVLLPGVDAEGARRVAEELRREVTELKMEHRNSPVAPFVTISVGCASLIPSPGHGSEELVRAADTALYRAKENGKNRIEG